jgi:hypothetical protein
MTTNMPEPDDKDRLAFPISAQNVVTGLLAGFAGILGFLGLRSGEVTDVLRNDPRPATVVAGTLLLAVLAGLVGVALPRKADIWWPYVAGVALLLFGASALVIYLVPVKSAPIFRMAALIASAILAGVGLLVVLATALYFKKWKRTAEETPGARRRTRNSFLS